jgi:hypothetical protein
MVFLERAKSGRSSCKSSKAKIGEGEWRIGIEGGQYLQKMWQLPLPFLQSIKVELASNAKAKSRGASGTNFIKGELRLAICCQTTKHWYRPHEAAAVLQPVLQLDETAGFELKSLQGFDGLEHSDQELILEALNTSLKRKLVQDNSSPSTVHVPSPKKARTSPSDTPGWCSDPSRQLSEDEVGAVLANYPDPELNEKALTASKAKVPHQLVKIGNTLVEYVGVRPNTKIQKPDKERFLAMAAAAKKLAGNEGCTSMLLLGSTQHICKRNTLPQLVESGVVVQRSSSSVGEA